MIKTNDIYLLINSIFIIIYYEVILIIANEKPLFTMQFIRRFSIKINIINYLKYVI